MNVFFPTRRLLGGEPGSRCVEVPRLHIGWNDADLEKWKEEPYRDGDGKLAYGGGAVIVIREEEGKIEILIVKSHTGEGNGTVGEVRVVDGTHTTEVTVDNPVIDYRPRAGRARRPRRP